MRKSKIFINTLIFLGALALNLLYAQNPLIKDQFTADPTARVFNGKIFIYPSHDILANENRGRVGWFCMEDYHVFSSENLTDWEDHGVILSQNNVTWVDSNSYSMWAPDCIEKNGKYYFYFPSISKDKSLGRGFSIGVAVSDFPYGPFIPQPDPIKNVRGIDPNAFIDNNGQAYLYWSARKIFVAKLNETMLELDSEPIIIDNLPTEGLKEGPFMFERNGIYYLTYPHVENNTERLEYAIADNPLGPFKVTGVIMDESPECWTNHQSIVEYKNQWFLFYHFNDLSPHFDKNRSVRADSLFFNEDGSIKKVLPTLRGVGISDAKSKIQIDRYSLKSDNGVTIEFIDTLKRFDGWKTLFDKADSWIQYNSVDFKEGNSKYLKLKIKSKDESNLQLVQDNSEGEILAEFKIPYSSDWKEINVPLLKTPQGVHNILLKLVDVYSVEIDWIHFE